MSILDWSTNPANNTLKPGIDWSEGMLPSQVNNSARQMMADMANWLVTPSFPDATSLTFAGTVTAATIAATTAMTVNGVAVFTAAGGTFTGNFGRDANFFFSLASSNPRITFDSGDYLEYDRTANKLTFYVGSTAKASIDSSGNMKLAGNITAATTP
ncbi:MAG: hypothetical protein WC889_02780 [Myxococcota bacterium]|jgi:hypothetical protein